MYKQQVQRLLALPKVEQKSEEWYEMRRNMITASDFAQALGQGKFGTQRQLIEKKCLPRENETAISKTNPFFKWGIMFEPVACEIYSMMHNANIHEFGLIKHPVHDFFGASPDGITDDGIMVEIKCPFKRKLTGDIPLQYYYQIQGQLDVCGLQECDYFECTFEMVDTIVAFNDPLYLDKYRGVLTENEDGSYVYGHIYAPGEECPPSDVGSKKLWVLKEFNLKRVQKDHAFVTEKLNMLADVWNKILYYRSNPEAFELEIIRSVDISTEPLNNKEQREGKFGGKTTNKRSGTTLQSMLERNEYLFLD
jgi:putative phage-type endonuclease